MMEDGPVDSLFERMSPEQMDDVLSAVCRVIQPRGGASDWTLQKTYYLACVESIEDRLTALPDPRFFSWTHGPWSKDLRQLVDMAASAGDLELALVPSKYRSVTRVYRWPHKREIPPMANPEDAVFLEGFVTRIAGVAGEELTRLSKETIPYKHTARGRLIDFDQYLESRKKALEQLSNDENLARILESRGH